MHGQGRHPPWIEELHRQRGDENGEPGPISLLDAPALHPESGVCRASACAYRPALGC